MVKPPVRHVDDAKVLALCSFIAGALATIMGVASFVATVGYGVRVRVKGTDTYWTSLESIALASAITVVGVVLLKFGWKWMNAKNEQ
jgi:hypothetical protein